MLKYEGYISNYLGVNIKKHSYGMFKLSKLYLVEKIINHVRLIVSKSLKSRETPTGKPLLHKDKSILGRKCLCKYSAVVGILSYLL